MAMNRRTAIGLLAGASTWRWTGAASAASTLPPWDQLAKQLGPVLQPVSSPLQACADAGGTGSEALFAALKNPYYLGDEPGLTQTLGWVDAWTSRPSSYVVAAESAAHVATAVEFARAHQVRLVVKGGGHSYFGNSNAADSLLVWTRRMQSIALHDTFKPAGAPASEPGVAAVTVGAGCLWGRVYEAVAVKAGRYVQGGGCLTVGVTGFTFGGGFGSFSKAFGTGASNLLEAEVVTPDGRTRIVNAHQHADLFYALRGGGGGTFAIATRLTIRTHPLPATMGAVLFSVTASNEQAWRALLTRLIALYAEALFNPHWGEQLRFEPGFAMSATMLFQGLTEQQARAIWQPLFDWIGAQGADYQMGGAPVVIAIPGAGLWDADVLRTLPGIVLQDSRAGAAPANIFWASNLSEAAQVINAYESAWLPQALLRPDRQPALVDALMAGSAVWPMALHVNKGLAGGSPDAIARTRATATNPQVLDAFALLICAADAKPAWPGIDGHEPDVANGRREAARVAAAMVPIRKLVPDAGAYVSESDYFQKDWQRAYWGGNYAKLLAAKRRYDPDGLLHGRNTVGT